MINEWGTIATILGSAFTIGIGVVAMVRHMLRGEFVTRAQHEGMVQRMGAVERHIAAMPAEHEVTDLTRRLGAIETGVAVAQTTIDGVNAGLKRVEHTVGLLLTHQLNGSRE